VHETQFLMVCELCYWVQLHSSLPSRPGSDCSHYQADLSRLSLALLSAAQDWFVRQHAFSFCSSLSSEPSHLPLLHQMAEGQIYPPSPLSSPARFLSSSFDTSIFSYQTRPNFSHIFRARTATGVSWTSSISRRPIVVLGPVSRYKI